MESRFIASFAFILFIFFISISCVLDFLIPRSPTIDLEIWGRTFIGIMASSAFICFGLFLVTIPHNWLEKKIPLYDHSKQPNKLIVGVIGIILGISGIVLEIVLGG